MRRPERRSCTPTRCLCAATISSAAKGNRAPGTPTETYGTGWPSNAGGRLVGSLAGLPYALAEAEQNFLIPTQTQALIWGDLVPQMILSAKIPRWWNVTPSQLHWVGLHLRYGRELLAESAFDPALRDAGAGRTIGTLAIAGAHVRRWPLCRAGRSQRGRRRVTPSELFSLARDVGLSATPASSCSWRKCAQLAPSLAQRGQLRSDLAGLRHAQADAGQFLPAGAAEPAHLPDPDGIFQPHHGGELGIQHALLGGSGRRDRACRPSQLNMRFRSGRRNWWSASSPRTWKIGRRC